MSFPELSRRCGECGQEKDPDQLIYQGSDFEPVCLPCLDRLDPARAALLRRLRPGAPGAGKPSAP